MFRNKLTFLEKMIDRYVKAVWGADYVRLSELDTVIVQAQQKEADRLRPIHMWEKQQLALNKDRERMIEVADLKAEIVALNSDMDTMRIKIQEAEEIKFNSIVRAKLNARLGADVWSQVKRFLEEINKCGTAISKVQNRTQLHLQNMLTDDISSDISGGSAQLKLEEEAGKR